MRHDDFSSPEGESAAVSTIIPTLDGRVRGVLRPVDSAHKSGKNAGLIVVLDDSDDAASLHEVVTELADSCRMAGISVLEIFCKTTPVSSDRVANPNRLALDVLAAISTLRSQGTTDVAVLLGLGTVSSVPVHRLENLLFSQFLAAGMAKSTEWQDAALHLASLTDTVRGAADSVRGMASIHLLLDKAGSPGEGADAACMRDEAVTSCAASTGNGVRRASKILYDWTVAILHLKSASTSAASTGWPGPEPVPLARALASHILAAQGRNLWRLNLRFLQTQWDSVLLDLDKRDATRSAEVRALLADAALTSLGGRTASYNPANYDPTGALQAARLTWHLLDRTARNQWLGAWNQLLPIRTRLA